MKKILFGATALLLLGACSGNGTTEKAREDFTRVADSKGPVESTEAAVEQVCLDSLRADSIQKKEEKSFYNSLPNIRKLVETEFRKETKYLHSLGFKGSFQERGKEEDWLAEGTFTLEKGQRKCVVNAHVDGYSECYKITITGDDEAKELYYNETKKYTRTKYGTPIKNKLKGNTIIVDIEDY